MVKFNTHGRFVSGEYEGLECFIADDTSGESGGYYLYLRKDKGLPDETIFEMTCKSYGEVMDFIDRNPVMWIEKREEVEG